MKFYVYALIDPRTDRPFYVGKGKDERAYHHLRETYARSDNKRKWHRIRKIREDGLEPYVEFLATDIDERTAFCIEKDVISTHGRVGFDENGILLNLSLGGDGPSGYRHTAETRALLSEKSKQRVRGPLSEETKAKISASSKGRKNTFTSERNAKISATVRSPEWREKYKDKIAANTAKITGRKKSEAEIEKIRAKLIGRQIPDEERARMLANKPEMTDEVREKISASKKGKPWSEARRAAQKRRISK